jgi:D-alanyl-D-alanine dipeptidase
MKKMQKNITIILAGVSLLISSANLVKGQRIESLTSSWKEINFKKTSILEKLAYADTANFMHEKIYPCAKCFLRPEAADALLQVNQRAAQLNLHLILFDCYRPKIYQQKMYDLVQNRDYVALPGKGSMHNKGLAVDIGLADSKGKFLDFGCAFDDFSDKAHFSYPGISDKAKANRKLLQEIMQQAGFEPYKNEWWHFNFRKVDYPVADFIWNCND